MIKILIFIIIFILLNINILDIIKIYRNNDYYDVNYKQCYILNNKSLYELETYRYNLNNYIYNIDNSNYKNTTNRYKLIYIILIILLFVFLILYSSTKNIKGIIIILILIIIYIYIGNIVIKNHKKIEELKKNNNNKLYKYNLTYKILNILLYLNDDNINIKEEIFKFKTDKKINKNTFDNIIKSNISYIYNISNELEIKYISDNAYKKRDFLKFINLDNTSPYYFQEYFDDIYIINNKNKIYLKDIVNNEYEKKSINDKINILLGDKKIIDPINYFNNNKDILLNNINLEDEEIVNIIKKYSHIIIHLLLYIILLMLILHYIYILINNTLYSIIIFILLLLYLILLWLILK